MKKTFNFGPIDYLGRGKADCIASVTAELKETEKGPVFSAMGFIKQRCARDYFCGGQCLDTIAEYVSDPLFVELYCFWKKYHLNDTHPECEHQAKAGWRSIARREVRLFNWTLTNQAITEKNKAENAAKAALQNGEAFTPTKEQTFFANLNYSVRSVEADLSEDLRPYYKPKKPLYTGDKEHVEIKALGWLKPDEHPEGVLCKPCPVCGYQYGTSFHYFPIPKRDLDRIEELLTEFKK